MMRAISIFMLCGLLASCQSAKGVSPQAVQDPSRLASVKSIYIDNLGKEEGADLIEGSDIVREEIGTRLATVRTFFCRSISTRGRCDPHRARWLREMVPWDGGVLRAGGGPGYPLFRSRAFSVAEFKNQPDHLDTRV